MSRTQIAVGLVRSGLSKAEAARRVGISTQAVCTASTKAGLGGLTEAGRKAMQAKSPEFKAKIAELTRARADRYRRDMAELGMDPAAAVRAVENGMSYRDAAKAFGISHNVIAGALYRKRRREAANAKR